MDNRQGLLMLPEKSVNLLIADPPYFEVKGDFDFVWKSFDEYLEFMEEQAKLYKRVLAENGTLFVYGHAKKIAYVQVIFDKYFNLENNLVWEKAEKDGLFGSTGSSLLRTFPPSTERILMYSNEIGRTGLEEIKLDVNNFKPLRGYFEYIQKQIGLGLKKINEKLGHRKAEHSFYWKSTQWDMPTPETYDQLIEMFRIDLLEGFKTYEELRREYEELRRPFENITKSTEILKFRFKPSDFNHETVKPETLTRALILTCSKENDLVVIPFAGSGTECAMAAKERRRFIGFEIDENHHQEAEERTEVHIRTPSLFSAV